MSWKKLVKEADPGAALFARPGDTAHRRPPRGALWCCDAGKTAHQELDGLNFMKDTTVALTNLLASALAEIKCVASIVFSSFNPPPSYRRYIQQKMTQMIRHSQIGSMWLLR